jgi:hypothetical protein
MGLTEPEYAEPRVRSSTHPHALDYPLPLSGSRSDGQQCDCSRLCSKALNPCATDGHYAPVL